MRNLVFIFLVSFISFTQAQRFTVSNNAAVIAQFTDLQTAIDSAQSGYEIYISGSVTNYSDIVVSKPLTLIGEGHTNLDGKMQTKIDELHLRSDNVTIIGIRVNNIVNNSSNDDANNIRFERCAFNGAIHLQEGANWILVNCLFKNDVDIDNRSNIIISNSIFDFTGNVWTISNSNSASLSVSNCVFISSGASQHFDRVSNGQFTNNIFFHEPSASLFNTGTTNLGNTFRNNVFMDKIDTTEVIADGNILINNVFIPEATIFSDEATYQVNAAAGLTTMANDGGEVGIYGGGFPMPNLRGTPNLPNVYDISVENSVIAPNEKLRVVIKARSED